MKQPFPPSMLAMDNEMEKFWQEYKRNQGLPVHPMGEQRVSGSTEGRADEHKSDGQGEGRRQVENRKGVRSGLRSESGAANLSPKHYQLQVPTTGNQAPDADSLWSSSHIAAETEADRQFIASAKLLAALPKKQKRFSWAGVIALLIVAAGVMWLAYSFVEGF